MGNTYRFVLADTPERRRLPFEKMEAEGLTGTILWNRMRPTLLDWLELVSPATTLVGLVFAEAGEAREEGTGAEAAAYGSEFAGAEARGAEVQGTETPGIGTHDAESRRPAAPGLEVHGFEARRPATPGPATPGAESLSAASRRLASFGSEIAGKDRAVHGRGMAESFGTETAGAKVPPEPAPESAPEASTGVVPGPGTPGTIPEAATGVAPEISRRTPPESVPGTVPGRPDLAGKEASHTDSHLAAAFWILPSGLCGTIHFVMFRSWRPDRIRLGREAMRWIFATWPFTGLFAAFPAPYRHLRRFLEDLDFTIWPEKLPGACHMPTRKHPGCCRDMALAFLDRKHVR